MVRIHLYSEDLVSCSTAWEELVFGISMLSTSTLAQSNSSNPCCKKSQWLLVTLPWNMVRHDIIINAPLLHFVILKHILHEMKCESTQKCRINLELLYNAAFSLRTVHEAQRQFRSALLIPIYTVLLWQKHIINHCLLNLHTYKTSYMSTIMLWFCFVFFNACSPPNLKKKVVAVLSNS